MFLIKRSIVPLFTLVSIICCVYYMTSTSSQLQQSLGDSSPINLVKDSTNKVLQYTKQPPVKEMEEPDTDESVVQEFTETPFMPKMQNETLKAELGRSSWRLFHTILARYPEQPSLQERNTLDSYIHLFGQIYPCGDCARHFQTLLKKYPPQTNSRKTAALWGCHVHNKVNERLNKDEYDCTKILEDYDCGCGEDEEANDETLNNKSLKGLEVVKEELQKGG